MCFIVSGTRFQEDKVAQGHLKSLGNAFHDISKTEEGKVLLDAMEGLASRIQVELFNQNCMKRSEPETHIYFIFRLKVHSRMESRFVSV